MTWRQWDKRIPSLGTGSMLLGIGLIDKQGKLRKRKRKQMYWSRDETEAPTDEEKRETKEEDRGPLILGAGGQVVTMGRMQISSSKGKTDGDDVAQCRKRNLKHGVGESKFAN
ncbi:hypothetical protein F4680DRAFT_453042 [Xylaria scruposa]|nr:hypothetical protein F4680DRAFT_453042 [Xylaria scruposa]